MRRGAMQWRIHGEVGFEWQLPRDYLEFLFWVGSAALLFPVIKSIWTKLYLHSSSGLKFWICHTDDHSLWQTQVMSVPAETGWYKGKIPSWRHNATDSIIVTRLCVIDTSARGHRTLLSQVPNMSVIWFYFGNEKLVQLLVWVRKAQSAVVTH